MARFPLAEWVPLPENATQKFLKPTQFIVHTAVDHPGPTNLWRFFARTDVTVESHWWLRMDGRLEQFIDTDVQAHANLYGNSRALSVETEDEGDPAHTPWTPAQVDALVKLLVFVHKEHGIPLEIMPNWQAPGVGWHSMWGFKDGVNLTGGYLQSPWTNSRGKTCPGKLRIQQFINEVLPRAQAIVGDRPEESDVELQDWYQLVAEATGSKYSPAVELWQNLLNLQGQDLATDGLVGPKTEAAHERYTAANSGRTTSRPTEGQWRSLLHALRRANLVYDLDVTKDLQLADLRKQLEAEIEEGNQLALEVVQLTKQLANAKNVSGNRLKMLETARRRIRKARRALK